MDRVTPIDLDRAELTKRLRGYDVRAVDSLLRGASRSLHELRMENEALRERIAGQQDELDRARAQERVVQDVLVTAQRAADDTRVAAQRQADALLEEARINALGERVNLQGQASEIRLELERLRADRARCEADLRALLERHLRDLGPAPTLSLVHGEADAAGA